MIAHIAATDTTKKSDIFVIKTKKNQKKLKNYLKKDRKQKFSSFPFQLDFKLGFRVIAKNANLRKQAHVGNAMEVTSHMNGKQR